MTNTLAIAIGGLFGITIHAAVKISSINKKLATESFKSVLKKYTTTEWPSLLLAVLTVGAFMFIAGELIGINIEDVAPTNVLAGKLIQFIRILSIAVGYLADSLIYRWLGSTEQKLIKDQVDAGTPMAQIISTPNNTI